MIHLVNPISSSSTHDPNPIINNHKAAAAESGGPHDVNSTSPSPTSTTTTDDHPHQPEEAGEEGGRDFFLEFGDQLAVGSSSNDADQAMTTNNNINTRNGEIIEEDYDEQDARMIGTALNYYCGQLNHHDRSKDLPLTEERVTSLSSAAEEIVLVVEDHEIQEEGRSGSLFSLDYISSSSFNPNNYNNNEDGEDAVYVVVSSSITEGASMDALQWTLNQLHTSSATTSVFLVHVFPQIKQIPTPLGMMNVNQVNPEQKDKYISQQRDKRRDFLNKFINACTSAKVKVETILIESEMEAQAILDLIPVLNITKLVLPTTKPTLRKMRSKKASGSIVDEIVKAAACEVKLICEGEQVVDPFADSPPPPRTYNHTPHPSSSSQHQPHRASFKCGGCFKF